MDFKKIAALYKSLNGVTFVRVMVLEFARKLFFPEARTFFAQGGEDIHLLYLLDGKEKGFYLDIGCNHPIHFSNTFKLYLLGWQGILVDGNPHLIRQAKNIRKRDICLHALVSNENRDMSFYISEQDLYSSVNADHAKFGTLKNEGPEAVNLRSITLDEIIEAHVEEDQIIDLLSIDVEGHDLQVLKSITLTRYRPRIIVIEDLGHNKLQLEANEFVKYLKPFNYHIVSTDKQNLYFIRDEEFQ